MLASSTAAVAALLVAASAGSAPGDALPDLVSDPPSGPYVQVYAEPGGDSRLLLRFNGFVHNDGAGALEVRATGNSGGQMTAVTQRIYGTDGTTYRAVASGGKVQYETADGHGHFHLHSAMQYALFDETKTGIVAPSMKVGFCLLDSQLVSGSTPRRYLDGTNCEQGSPNAAGTVMGVSPGWRDVYGSTLAFQWVDISDVAPGSYWLASRSDPDGIVVESNEGNNGWGFTTNASVVPGYRASPASVAVSAGGPTSITLSAARHGQPGPVRYEVVAAPEWGTLDRAVGEVFDQPTVTYRPAAGFVGTDTFEVVARDSTSAFPRSPTPATITVAVDAPAPAVAISGAPASLTAGTGVQLTATVTGDPPPVTWSVNGTLGGSAALGTVSTGGFYTAPAAVPAAGRVLIRAASARAWAEVWIAIDAPRPPDPAPAPTPPSPPPPPSPPAPSIPPPPPAVSPVGPAVVTKPPATGGAITATTTGKANPLSVPVLSARGRRLLVGLASARGGALSISAKRSGKRIGGCVVRVPAGRSITCAIALRRGVALRGITVQIRLRVNGRVLASRTTRVSGVSVTSADGLRTLYCTLG